MTNSCDDKILHCLDQLVHFYAPKFGNADPDIVDTVLSAARFSFNTLLKSDASYHDVEHTILVTLCGQAILEGYCISGKPVSKIDWGHFTIALLFHDVGYVRGICYADQGQMIASGRGDEVTSLSANSTDAALSPYHVDRSQLFVRERFYNEFDSKGLFEVRTICDYIEMTRFPFPAVEPKSPDSLAELVRAADLIGQLGDPDRLPKCSALFKEFEEIGLNATLGYRRPEDLRNDNTRFYWRMVNPHVQRALMYLKLTSDGKEWIANLQANVGEPIM